MEIEENLNKVKELYSSNLAEKGVTSEAVGWNTCESQELRFEKLTQVIVERDAPVSINDYGCGYGAHLEYLKNNGIVVSEYNGYDISDDMLAAAEARLKGFTGKLNLIRSSEINTVADYTFVSGTFNVRFASSDEAWREFIGTKLIEASRHSRNGFSFNQLSTYVDWMEPHLYYGDPCYWFDLCKRNFSRYVDLLHDYPLYEWTIIVRNNR